MSGLFFWKNTEVSDSGVESIFPLKLPSEDFVKSDILATYVKILTDTLERTHGLKDNQEPLMWDSCVATQANKGLVTLLAEAMYFERDLFIVWNKKATNVLRIADQTEEAQIRKDYEKQAESKVGVFISFKNYRRTEMLKLYSNFEYCVIASLNKTLNLSKAIQVKVNDLRGSVALNDSSIAREQAKAIAKALQKGQDILIDKNDEIMTATPDTTSTEKAITFIDSKKAFILGLPLSYVAGEQTPGIGSTGEQDMRAVERGLKQYFVSIVRPVLKAIFGVDTEFKSQDFREINTSLEALKTFQLTDETLISTESKQAVIWRLFDLDPDKEKKLIEEEAKKKEKETPKNEVTSTGTGAATPANGDQNQQGGAGNVNRA